MKKGSGTFFVYQRFRGRTTRNGKQKQKKEGYDHGDGILPFVLYLPVLSWESVVY